MPSTRRRFLARSVLGAGALFTQWSRPAQADEEDQQWRSFDRATLDRAYNNAAAVPESAALFQGWQARSAALRLAHPQYLDLAYGPHPRNRIDYFAAPASVGNGTPVLVFFHGGYWQMRAKEDFAFLAEPYLQQGVSVALVGYPLAPEVRMDAIVADARAAIPFLLQALPALGGDPGRVVVSGWSAGAQLAAWALQEAPLRGGIGISGVYDLEPLVGSYLNDKLQLDVAAAQRNSPFQHLPRRSAPMFLFSGEAELPELRRQSAAFQRARQAAKLPGRLQMVAQANHYTILDSMVAPEGAIRQAILTLLDQG